MYSKEVFTCLLAFFFTVTHGLSSTLRNLDIADQPKIIDSPTPNANNSSVSCETPFHPVGSYCLLIDNRMLGTWSEMREICQLLGGDLVNMKDANILHDIFNYINDHELTDFSYWVGASSQNSEGIWKWSSDSSPVRMGAPLWGNFYGREPNGNGAENCTIISKFEFYYMHDENCDFQSHGVICQPATSVVSGSVNDFSDSEQPKECPPGFDAVGGTCLLMYTEETLFHGDAVVFCIAHDSHLVKIDDANLFGAVYDYILEKGGYPWFWIDGSDAMTEGEWLFYDGTPVQRGTPFWRVKSEDSQEPTFDKDNSFIAIDTDDYLFYGCPDFGRNAVICQFDI